jgi:PPOX class probable F420-dependent enzyme
VNEKEARRRVTIARVGRLASLDPSGRPHVLPVCFAVVDDRIVSVVDEKPKRTQQLRRLENLRRNPDVQLVVDHYDDDWSALWWVRMSGHARVVDHGHERDAAVDVLADKYEQYRAQRPRGSVIVIDITRITSWQATPG